jgi:sugar lactone lactonase YvrE
MVLALAPAAFAKPTEEVQGFVESNHAGLPDYQVLLYVAILHTHWTEWRFLGTDKTDSKGHFAIVYSPPEARDEQLRPLLFVEAVSRQVMLASAIGSVDNAPQSVVVDELTTVATGNAFAQFIDGSKITGNPYGMSNAVHMAANLADPGSGDVGVVLDRTPNGTETSTLATFNSLSNAVASCVAEQSNCEKLLKLATPAGEGKPKTVLQALANIVKNPSFLTKDGGLASDDPLFDLSEQAKIYSPFLAQRPTNWLLFLKITGGFYSEQNADNLLNGPANFAIDGHGDAWVANNYIPEPPSQYACAGNRLMEFYPWGQNFPGSPFVGGGISGAGYGITFDPTGNIWSANFGFQDPPCANTPQAATSDSVSLFRSNGQPISPADGYTKGDISWPQGTVSDRRGNIFVANCGNDSITEIPQGNPDAAFNIPLGPTPAPGQPQIKPFGEVVDRQGNVWVTDNFNDSVAIISPAGKLVDTLPGIFNGNTVLTHPVGDAVDSRGDVWVANSDWLDVPCPKATNPGTAKNPSITLYRANTRIPAAGSPFTGGGLTVPWGIAVDGDDTVWVFNFGAEPVMPPGHEITTPTGISRFCGTKSWKCPRYLRVGDPISPNTGYQSNALERITGGQIDPSGNIWVTGNWKINANPNQNPGGNSIAIVIGAAVPIRTPLIGPPVPFD